MKEPNSRKETHLQVPAKNPIDILARTPSKVLKEAYRKMLSGEQKMTEEEKRIIEIFEILETQKISILEIFKAIEKTQNLEKISQFIKDYTGDVNYRIKELIGQLMDLSDAELKSAQAGIDKNFNLEGNIANILLELAIRQREHPTNILNRIIETKELEKNPDNLIKSVIDNLKEEIKLSDKDAKLLEDTANNHQPGTIQFICFNNDLEASIESFNSCAPEGATTKASVPSVKIKIELDLETCLLASNELKRRLSGFYAQVQNTVLSGWLIKKVEFLPAKPDEKTFEIERGFDNSRHEYSDSIANDIVKRLVNPPTHGYKLGSSAFGKSSSSVMDFVRHAPKNPQWLASLVRDINEKLPQESEKKVEFSGINDQNFPRFSFQEGKEKRTFIITGKPTPNIQFE